MYTEKLFIKICNQANTTLFKNTLVLFLRKLDINI